MNGFGTGFGRLPRGLAPKEPGTRRSSRRSDATLPGAPRVPRSQGVTRKSLRGDLFEPRPGWTGSLNEWVVYAVLTRRLGYTAINEGGRDFYYGNVDIPLPGYLRGGKFRADFIIPYGPTRKLGAGFGYTAIIFDPYNEYTHADHALDLLRKNLLEQARYQYIFMEENALMADPEGIVRLGLRGRDVSPLGVG